MTKGRNKILSDLLSDEDVWPTTARAQLGLLLLLIRSDESGFVGTDVSEWLFDAPETLAELSELNLILAMDGGFRLIGEVLEYREHQTKSQAQAAARMARYRDRRRNTVTDDVTSDKTPQTPLSTSTSTSTSTGTSTNRGGCGGGERNEKRNTLRKPDDVEDEVWQDWLDLRKRKKATVTPRVVKSLRKQGQQAGMPLQAVLEMCVVHGWSAFRSSWAEKDQPTQRKAYVSRFQGDPSEAGEINF